MKFIYLLSFLVFPYLAKAQQTTKTKNIFIITTDGFRWQEVFTGADSSIINNERYNSDTALSKEMYWDSSLELRRKKLMPFFWNVIAKKGQLYGNRLLDNKVNMKNVYKISYPGYNEIFTGYADLHFNPNLPVNNNNSNILEYLNLQHAYSGKVVAFASWNVFPYIFNEKRSKFLVNSGYKKLEENGDTANILINQVQETILPQSHTRYDLLTFLSAKEYVHVNHPKVLFLGLGETDELAHAGKYDDYLQQATLVDKMISDLWHFVQSDPYYKDNTTFIITTDHGRGNNQDSWHKHNPFVKGSGETWLAMIGPGIAPLGEIKTDQQMYENQLAATIALLLGEKFTSSHTIGKPIILPSPIIDKSMVGKSR